MARTARKKVGIFLNGVSVTDDVSYINFTGGTVTTAPNGGVTVDLSGGGGGSLSIGSAVSGSTNYASLYVDGSGNLANSFQLSDSAGVSALDFSSTYPHTSNLEIGNGGVYINGIIDTSGATSINSLNRILYSSDGIPRFNWQNGVFLDDSSGQAMDVKHRLLGSTGITQVLDWSGGNPSSAVYYFDSANGYRLTGSAAGLTNIPASGSDTWVQYNNSGTLGADSGFTYDKAGNVTLSGTLRANQIQSASYADTGGNLFIDPANKYLLKSGGSAIVDFSNFTANAPYYFVSDVLQGSGAGLSATMLVGKGVSGTNGNQVMYTDNTGLLAQDAGFRYGNAGAGVLQAPYFSGDGSGLTFTATPTLVPFFDGSSKLTSNGAFHFDLSSGNLYATGFVGDGTSVYNLVPSNITGYPTNVSYVLKGNGTWAAVDAGTLTGVLPVANGGTGQSSAVNVAYVQSASSITPIADGTYPLSSTFGGSISFQSGFVTAFTSIP